MCKAACDMNGLREKIWRQLIKDFLCELISDVISSAPRFLNKVNRKY